MLTNGSEENTRTLLGRAGLTRRVERIMTTEQAGAYKPHGWDVLGAREAGCRAILVDRGEGWPFPLPEPERAESLAAAAEAAVA